MKKKQVINNLTKRAKFIIIYWRKISFIFRSKFIKLATW